MKIRTRHIPLLFLLILWGCSQKQNGHSEVRLTNFMQGGETVTINISGSKNTSFSEELQYGEHSEYLEIPEGQVNIKIETKGQVLIEKKLGIGKNARYTMALHGMLPTAIKKNETTTSARLLEIFEGITSHPPNGGLPSLSINLDRFEGDPEMGQLKIVHLTPGFTEAEIRVIEKEEMKKVTALKYPETSGRLYPLSPGSHRIEVHYAASPLTVYKGEVNISASALSTIYLIPKQGDAVNKLEVVQLDTPLQKQQ